MIETRDELIVSTIGLVDLAGSGRVNQARTVGERVKEASECVGETQIISV